MYFHPDLIATSSSTIANGQARMLFEPNDDLEPAVIEIPTQNFKGQYLVLDEVVSEY